MEIVDEKAELRQKRIMIALFSVCFLGLSYLIYDYVQMKNRVSLPENLDTMESVVEQWKTDGLVLSFDARQGILKVNEHAWTSKKPEEKIGIIAQLGRYCAGKNKSKVWQLRVVSGATMRVLGEMGSRGLRLY